MDKCNPLTADGERIVKYDDWDSRHEAESKSINDKVAGSYERMKLAGKGSKTIKKLREANKRRKRNQEHERRLKAARKAYLKALCKGAKSKTMFPECRSGTWRAAQTINQAPCCWAVASRLMMQVRATTR